MRPIDADRLKDTLKQLDVESNDIKWKSAVEESIYRIFPQIIDDEPTIEVEAVNRGQWIYGEYDGQDGIFCSECGHFVHWCYDYYDKVGDLINDNPRCPNCGARMDGD